MSDKKFKENLSLKDLSASRLKTTNESIAEMENILSLMDEIEEIQKNSSIDKREIEKLQSSVGGYSRVEIVNLLSDLKAQRDLSMSDIEKEKESLLTENKTLKSDIESMKNDINNLTRLFSKQVEFNKIDSQAEYLDSQNENIRYTKLQEELETLKSQLKENKTDNISEEAKMLKAGDNTLILESIYSGLAKEIESLKNAVAKELNFSYTQQQAIYEDLSQQLSNVGSLDIKNFEDRLTEISQLKATDIKVLEEKIEKINALDYNNLVEAVSDKIIEKMSGQLLCPPDAQPLALAPSSQAFDKVSDELKEIKAQLAALTLAKPEKDTSEFSLLDYEIQEYLKDSSPIALSDLLVDARNIKNRALKYMENGNNKRTAELIDGLKARLRNTSASGSRAIEEILRIAEQYHIPLSVSKQKLSVLKTLMFKYEQGSIMPDFDLINDLIRNKKDTFKDSGLTVLDKQTFEEISAEAVGLDLTSTINGEKAERLRTLKKELTGFNLACVFDFDIARLGSEITDTDLLLAEIKALKSELKGEPKAQQNSAEQTEQEITSLSDEITKLSHSENSSEAEKKARKKPKKILRPSLPVSAVKTSSTQALATKKLKTNISAVDDPNSLSSELVKKLAENMASRLSKK